MKQIITVLIVTIVLIGAGMFYYFYATPDDDNENMLNQSIIIEYQDGTKKTLDNDISSLNSVEYENKPVKSIAYRLTAEATGEGYDYWKYKDWDLEITITDSNNNVVYGGTTQTINEDDNKNFDVVYEIYNEKLMVKDILGDDYPGIYTLKYEPKGSFQYQGNPSPEDEWYVVALPAGLEIDLEVIDDTNIEVNLDDGYNAYEDVLLELDMEPDTTYNIWITEYMIIKSGSCNPEDVFASLLVDSEIYVTYWDESENGWDSYVSTDTHNTLECMVEGSYAVSLITDNPDTLIIPYEG